MDSEHSCNLITLVSIIISPFSALAGVFLKDYLDKKVFLSQEIRDAYKLSDQLIYSGTNTHYYCTTYKDKKLLPIVDDKSNEISNDLGLIVFIKLDKLDPEFKHLQRVLNKRGCYYGSVLLGQKEYDAKLAKSLQDEVIDSVVEFQIQLKKKYLRGYFFMIRQKLIQIKNKVCNS